jgi:putative DNA primase/helicase
MPATNFNPMMHAADAAAILGDAQREGRSWRCRCPLHGGRSLVLRDGNQGRLLATCWGGCDRRDLLAELRRCGLLRPPAYSTPVASRQRAEADTLRIAHGLTIWRNSEPAASGIVERYLGSRGITFDQWPAALRFHPRCPRPKDQFGNLSLPLPAMVALVEHVERGSVAVHCTYLRRDGDGKAPIDNPKAMFGPVSGGAVRFGEPQTGKWLAIAEGIETALSVAVACSIPSWAALSASGIKNLILPAEASHLIVCADHDSNGIGESAARDAASRWFAEGRRVRIAVPPEPGSDFNDVLNGDALEKTEEAPHA